MDPVNTYDAGWFVIYTKPRHEKRIIRQLDHLDVCHFLPIIKTLRNWSDRKKYVDVPLFPSYIFVKLKDAQAYFDTLDIEGILYYVRSGKQIARISETIINNLRLIISNAVAPVEVSTEVIRPGTLLRIKEGPFIGFCCEVIEHRGRQKILVRIELLKRNILLDVPVESLMPASIA
ncbi:MAG: UpxY family transcription antiterminator [Chitinophagaceae bacterium]